MPRLRLDRNVIARLAAQLQDAGFTEERLSRLLDAPALLSLRAQHELVSARLGDSRLETLAHLFSLGSTVSRQQAASALRPFDLGELRDARLLVLDRDVVRARVRLTPYRGLLLANDVDREWRRRPGYVTGVNETTRLLDRLTIRSPVGHALDLGAGCGVQALLAARHANAAIATDANPRALHYIALNAALNGVENVQRLQGSWYEPVAGRRFDLIVANPPYVISPDTSYLYRDSGLSRDEVARRVVSQAAAHLDEGGFAHVLCNWIVSSGGDWREAPEAWIAGMGCDAVLILYGRHDPLSYAAVWNHPLDQTRFPQFVASFKRWLAYYRREGIEEIAFGLIALRRRSAGRNWVRAVEAPSTPSKPAGAHLLRLFEARDMVHRLREPAEVLALPLAPAEGTTFDEQTVFADGSVTRKLRIGLQSSAGFSAAVDPSVGAILGRCDGVRPLGLLVNESAPGHEALRAIVAAEAIRLVELGLMTAPAGS